MMNHNKMDWLNNAGILGAKEMGKKSIDDGLWYANLDPIGG